MRKIKSILVVANRDDTDKPLLEKAVQLARRLGARLELFACDAEHAYIMRPCLRQHGHRAGLAELVHGQL